MEYKIEYKRRFTEALRHINPGVYLPTSGKFDRYSPDGDYGTSPLNTPYFDQIKVKTIPINDEPEEYTFPNDPLVNFTYAKNFAKTPLWIWYLHSLYQWLLF